jgi:hypothetical protein
VSWRKKNSCNCGPSRCGALNAAHLAQGLHFGDNDGVEIIVANYRTTHGDSLEWSLAVILCAPTAGTNFGFLVALLLLAVVGSLWHRAFCRRSSTVLTSSHCQGFTRSQSVQNCSLPRMNKEGEVASGYCARSFCRVGALESCGRPLIRVVGIFDATSIDVSRCNALLPETRQNFPTNTLVIFVFSPPVISSTAISGCGRCGEVVLQRMFPPDDY